VRLDQLGTGRLLVVGLSADFASEAEEIRRSAEQIAGRVVNVVPLPYDSDRKTMLERLETANLALMLSWHEGFGLTGWEAIAAEIPLIVGRNSGLYKLVEQELGASGTALLLSVDVKGRTGEQGEPNYHPDDLTEVSNNILRVASDLKRYQAQARELKLRLIQKLGCTWQRAGQQFLAGLGIIANDGEHNFPSSDFAQWATQTRSGAPPPPDAIRQELDPERVEEWRRRYKELLVDTLAESDALLEALERTEPTTPAGQPKTTRLFDRLMMMQPFGDAVKWLRSAYARLNTAGGRDKPQLIRVCQYLIPWLFVIDSKASFTRLQDDNFGEIIRLPIGLDSFAEIVTAGIRMLPARFPLDTESPKPIGKTDMSEPPFEGPFANLEQKLRRKLLDDLRIPSEFGVDDTNKQDELINTALRTALQQGEPIYYFTFYRTKWKDSAWLGTIAGLYPALAVIELDEQWKQIHGNLWIGIRSLLGRQS
jgi:hypothetical protein